MAEKVSLADAHELLVSNLALIERSVRFVARRYNLTPDDEEEFAAVVKLRLIENDYAILRKFEGRSSLTSYVTIVVQRLLLDHRIHLWGKWHPSAEAQRLGDLAVDLEKLVRRDGRTIDEALLMLRGTYPAATRDELLRIADRLPERAPKKRIVDLDEAAGIATPADHTALAAEERHLSERVSSAVREFLGTLPPDHRLALQLRFDGGMTVADIARSMRLDQKKLYRTMESHLRNLRRALEDQGIAAADAVSLIGNRGAVLDFHLDEART